MKVLRFVLPFLFVRNWHSGEWELSRARVAIYSAVLGLVFLALLFAYILQTPVTYKSGV